MGCFPDKTKKEIKDNLRNTSTKQNLALYSANKLPVMGNMAISHEKEGQGVQQNNQSQSITQTGPVSHNYSYEKKAIQQLVKKYKIKVKQSAYKTNSIHAYSYQQLLHFNPQTDLQLKAERQLFDKSYIFNMNRESVLPIKFRVNDK